MQNYKSPILLTAVIAIIAGVFACLASANIALAWTGPSQSPPGGNITAPLNTATTFSGDISGTYNNITLSGSGLGCTASNTGLYYNGTDIVCGVVPGQWSVNGTNLYYNGGSVGIGISTPSSKLEVADDVAGSVVRVGVKNTNNTGFASYRIDAGSNVAAIGLAGPSYSLVPSLAGALIINNAVSAGANSVGDIIFVAGGASTTQYERMRIDAGGNVGIGTIDPKNILHLDGNTGNFALTFTNAANDVGSRGYRIGFDNNRLTFQSANDDGTFLSNQVSIIPSTGHVGIGTTSPNSTLHIADGTTAEIDIQSRTSNHWAIYHDYGTEELRFWNNDIAGVKNALTIDNLGNIGIGTTANPPTSMLTVSGTAEFSRKGIAGKYLGGGGEVQGIWSIGQPWAIDTTNNDFGNQYGMVYAHNNASSVGTDKGPIASWGHQILFTDNGSKKAAISLSSGHGYFAGSVGIGTTTLTQKLTVAGNIYATGNICAGSNCITSAGGVITGTGADNYIPRFNGTNALENSSIYDNGNIGIGNANPNRKFHVTQAADTAYPTLGTAKGAMFIAGDTNLYGLYTGINTLDGNAWMQAMRNDSATAYNIILQPSGGNVGIGTSTPQNKLDVNGGVSITGANTTGKGLTLSDQGTHKRIQSWESEPLLINPEGNNVNIGYMSTYAAPAEALQVNGNIKIGTSDKGIIFYGGGEKIIGTAGYGIDFQTSNGTSRMTILNDGKVGIGTTGPGQKLDVSGNIRSTGGHIINNTSPTITFQDTDQLTGFIHVNSNKMYILTSDSVNDTAWTAHGTYWPLQVNLDDDVLTFGGEAHFMEGNVGIGTSGPGEKLQVAGNAYVSNVFSVGPTKLQSAYLNVQGSSGVSAVVIKNADNNQTWFDYNGTGINYLRGNNVLSDVGGNVSIGTSAMSAKLNVYNYGGAQSSMAITNDNGDVTWFDFQGNGTNYLRGSNVLSDTGGTVTIGGDMVFSQDPSQYHFLRLPFRGQGSGATPNQPCTCSSGKEGGLIYNQFDHNFYGCKYVDNNGTTMFSGCTCDSGDYCWDGLNF